MRLMGKKQLGELQPFEFAITLIVAELACIPMADIQVPVLYGLVPIFALFVVELVFTKTVKHSIKMRKLINGKPVIVITPDGIDYKAISNLDMTIHDLMEALRCKNYFSPKQINYAICETNGELTVIPKANDRCPTLADLNLQKQEEDIPYSIICEGKILSDNMEKTNLTNEELRLLLQYYKLKTKDVLLLLVNGDNFYLQPISGKCIQNKFSEVVNV